MRDKPTFSAWKRESVDMFALEAFDSMTNMQETIESLRRQLLDEKTKYLARIRVLEKDVIYLTDYSRNHHR